MVISRFRNKAVFPLATLTLDDGSSLTATVNHPFWSETRHEWGALGDLEPGELLRTAHGPLMVTSLALAGAGAGEEVYNIEVRREHVYQLLDSGVLSHNARKCGAETNPQDPGQLAKLNKQYAKQQKYGDKPYADPSQRPKYAKGQEQATWDAAKKPDGKVYDPHTGQELTRDPTKPRKGQWDMGHKSDHKYSDLHKDYMDGKISKSEFLSRYRDPSNYHPENPLENQSHRHE